MYHLRHRLRIFLFHRKAMFCSQDIPVFLFLTIPWFTKSVTSWWVLVHETGCIFEYLLNHNSVTHQTWSIDRCKLGQYFSEIFRTIWKTGAKFQALFNSATCSNYSINNCVKCCFLVLYMFLKGWKSVNKGQLKMISMNY